MARTGAENAQLGADLRDIAEQVVHAWTERSEGSDVAPIAAGFEYGRLFNRSWLGVALEEE